MTSYMVGGILSSHLPAARGKDDPVKPCCAKCRRGVPGFGTLPCGLLGDCECHVKKVAE